MVCVSGIHSVAVVMHKRKTCFQPPTPSIGRFIMELTSSFAKHVLTLIITFSVAVMDAQDLNMFEMSSITCSVMELLCCVLLRQ